MADDTPRRLTGAGLAHTMPSRPPRDRRGQPNQPVTKAPLLLHWTQYWEPRCILASKHTHEPTIAMQTYRESYDRRIATLFRAGISWDMILRNDLDSPLQSGVEFDRALALAIERRRSRMGRVKGQGKKYAARNRNGSEPCPQRGGTEDPPPRGL